MPVTPDALSSKVSPGDNSMYEELLGSMAILDYLQPVARFTHTSSPA